MSSISVLDDLNMIALIQETACRRLGSRADPRIVAMTGNYLVTSVTRLTTSACERLYPTVESALRGADAILDKGADSVWIVDREGTLILPADQVRLRLSPWLSSRPAPLA